MYIDIPKDTEFYQQEGDMVPFACLPWVYQVADFDERFFDQDFKHLYGFVREDYAWAYWDVEKFNQVSRDVYNKFGEGESIDKIYQEYRKHAEKIEDLYQDHSQESISTFSKDKLNEFFDNLRKLYKNFWQVSLFIDAFDAGFDQEKIKEVANDFGFSDEEVRVLTTPQELTYKNSRKLALLRLVKTFKNQTDHENLDEFIKQSDDVEDYIENFDYHKSSYSEIKHITKEEIIQEAESFIENPQEAENDYKELKNHTENKKTKQEDILREHDLESNPLYFFQKLSYWREDRKKVNLMGIHLLNYILSSIEQKLEIERKYLSYLLYDEVEKILHGKISASELVTRFEDGLFIASTEAGVKSVSGQEAEKLWKKFQELSANRDPEADTIDGVAASSDVAVGDAKIIMTQDQFDSFNEGEVLVTGMTRPEFVPLMKKAAAIITNEGGITSHAAIVSRELDIPCVIGTQNATKILENGDKVEVNADEGVVKIVDKD